MDLCDSIKDAVFTAMGYDFRGCDFKYFLVAIIIKMIIKSNVENPPEKMRKTTGNKPSLCQK